MAQMASLRTGMKEAPNGAPFGLGKNAASRPDGVYSVRGGRKLSVFVLELEHGTFLVGRTSLQTFTFEDILKRSITPTARHWLDLHRPFKILIVYQNCSAFDEDKYVKMFMKYHGVENVRGGSYSSVILDPLLKRLILHEIEYVESTKKPQTQTSSLISSQLGVNESLSGSVLAESTILDSHYTINETPVRKLIPIPDPGPTMSEWMSEWVYDTYVNAYATAADVVYEISRQLWPWSQKS